MTQVPRTLSLKTRAFLLVFAALAIAEGTGLALTLWRPPMHHPPVTIAELSRMLAGTAPRGMPPPPGGAGPPAGGAAPPPEHISAEVVRLQPAAPAVPATADPALSAQVATLLAAELRVPADRVRVGVARGEFQPPRPGGPPGETSLREGFVAALQLDDGRWRVVESVPTPFPNAFHRQALWLFLLGLLALLPLAWWFASTLSRPLARFAAAAGRGALPGAPALPVEGPAEMREAAVAFNAMQEQVHVAMAERARVMAAVAHDLRTPIARLAFRIEEAPEPLRTRLQADVDELRGLVGAALEFSAERARPVRRERLDFRLLVESVVDGQADTGAPVHLAEGLPVTLEGDPVALRRAVANLVGNALQYGQRADLALQLDGSDCVLFVDDAGPGIPEDRLEEVFEPFRRLEESRNRATGGMGLGLAVVRTVVQDHGGTVGLANRAGGGLRVTVRLPLG